MKRRVRTLFASAAIVVVAALGVSVVGAAPASADPLPIIPVGSLDTLTVQYDESSYSTPSALPYLSFSGWAGDVSQPSRNGHSGTGPWYFDKMYLTVSWHLPDGRVIEPGYLIGDDQFAGYRPDVHAAYPYLGSNQGFSFAMEPPSTGPMTVCVHVYELDAAYRESGPFACQKVTVPSAPPGYHPRISYAGNQQAWPAVGTPLSLTFAYPTGGRDSVQWFRSVRTDGSSGPTTAIAGATGTELATDASYLGRYVGARFRSTDSSGTTIEFRTDDVHMEYPAPAPAVQQVSSDDRYSTSVATSQRAFPDASVNVPVAYIASGATFPDALSAGAAAVHLGGTLLLTPPDRLDARVAAELTRLHPAKIVVAGGPATVSDDVLTALSALPFAPQVKRISGADRFEVSRNLVEDAFGQSVPALYLTTGNGFADALTAGVAGAVMDRPVLLTNGSAPAMDQATTDALTRWNTKQVTIVGGTSSVTPGVASGIPAAATVSRSSGADRYAAAAALAKTLPASDSTYLAYGGGFADALTTAVLAHSVKAPLLLSVGACSTPTTIQTLIDRRPTALIAVGGSASQDPYAWEHPCGP